MALSEDGALLFHKEDMEGPSHAVSCGVFVEEALSFAESHAIPLDGVAVSQGPGSYTGLRIGVSMAKGVCYGRVLVPMIDARRMEVYAAVYDRALKEKRAVQPDVVNAETYLPWLEQGPVCFFGNGAAKCKDVITHPNALFIDGINPLAKYMLPLAEQAMARQEFQDVAYFEPFYLKEFIATKAKNLI